MAFPLLLIATAVIGVLTLLPVCRYEAWWIRGLDFPRLQLFSICSILLIIQIGMLELSSLTSGALILVNSICLVYHAWWIAPYTRLFPSEVKNATQIDSRNRLSLITANVLTPNRNARALIELVQLHSPDILVTLESDSWWEEQLTVLENEYPYTIKCPLDNLYGMHVYSRLELSDRKIEYLVEPDVPSIHALATLRSGQNTRVHFVHPAPPSPTENEKSSERDAELILIAKSVQDSDLPVVVSGDLNDVAWSATTRLFRKVSGLLDPRVGRGMFNTYHADHWFARWPLDHIFHSSHFRLENIQRLPNIGSDHFPILTKLQLEYDQEHSERGLDTDSDDTDWAEKKLRQQAVDEDSVPQPGE